MITAIILGLIMVAIIIAWALILYQSQDTQRRVKSGLCNVTPNKDFYLALARSSALKFLIGGGIAVLAYWSELDWGMYSTIAITLFEIIGSKLENLDN